jgi:hypothetical protein
VCRYYRLEKLLILCLHPRCRGSILRCNTLPMKEFGDLIVCSSNSSKNYRCVVEPRLQPCAAEDISPCPISVSETPFPCHHLAYSIVARWASQLSFRVSVTTFVRGERAWRRTNSAAVVGHWQSRHNRAIGETAACGCVGGRPSHLSIRSTDREASG